MCKRMGDDIAEERFLSVNDIVSPVLVNRLLLELRQNGNRGNGGIIHRQDGRQYPRRSSLMS